MTGASIRKSHIHGINRLIYAPDRVKICLRPVDMVCHRTWGTWPIQIHEAFVALFSCFQPRIQLKNRIVAADYIVIVVDDIYTG